MTNSTSSIMAILFGLGVFAVIVAVGWRSVQNRRILRLQNGDGETIIVAGEGDEISSVVSTIETTQVASPAVLPAIVANKGVAEPTSAADPAMDAEAEVAGHDRLARVVSATK